MKSDSRSVRTWRSEMEKECDLVQDGGVAVDRKMLPCGDAAFSISAHAVHASVLPRQLGALASKEPVIHESARGYELREGRKPAIKEDGALAGGNRSEVSGAEFERIRHRACFCPQCFAGKSFWREEWEYRGVLACLVHNLRLVTRCPICKRSLTWQRSDLYHCKCGFPLALWPHEPADDGEAVATRFVLLQQGDEPATELQNLLPGARVSLLRALGYAWLGRVITSRQRLGGLGEEGDACAYAAAGDAILRLREPLDFLIGKFPLDLDPKFRELQKLVAAELYRSMHRASGPGLRDLIQKTVAKLFARRRLKGSVLSYWIPIFLGSSDHWPVDIETATSKRCFLSAPYDDVWAKRPARVQLEDLRKAWITRQRGQSSRELASDLNVPAAIVGRMLRRLCYGHAGATHRYAPEAVQALLRGYPIAVNEDDYIDVATVLRHGVKLDECVNLLRDPTSIKRRAVALVQREHGQELMFAKWMLPYWSPVRVVVPYGYGGNLCDLRWASLKIAARYLRVEQETVVRWVEEGRLGIVMPGVPSETMGISREALRHMRREMLKRVPRKLAPQAVEVTRHKAVRRPNEASI